MGARAHDLNPMSLVHGVVLPASLLPPLVQEGKSRLCALFSPSKIPYCGLEDPAIRSLSEARAKVKTAIAPRLGDSTDPRGRTESFRQEKGGNISWRRLEDSSRAP